MSQGTSDYGTVWYKKIDSEEVDGVEGDYTLEALGGEVMVRITPTNDDDVPNPSEQLIFPWNRIMRIDTHAPDNGEGSGRSGPF